MLPACRLGAVSVSHSVSQTPSPPVPIPRGLSSGFAEGKVPRGRCPGSVKMTRARLALASPRQTGLADSRRLSAFSHKTGASRAGPGRAAGTPRPRGEPGGGARPDGAALPGLRSCRHSSFLGSCTQRETKAQGLRKEPEKPCLGGS